MSRPDVSVVIVNYNAGDALAATLQSLPAGLEGLTWDAVVVDNASADGSSSAVRHADPRVRLLQHAANVGFARGVNAGLQAMSGALVLILNPDCHLEPGTVTRLIDELRKRPSCGLAGPRILDADGTLQESARGDPNFFTGLFGRSSLLSRWLPSLAVARRNLVAQDAIRAGHSSVVVDWVSGACMLARREALDRVRGFDEAYFLYWEDADLCRRLRNAGWHVRYVPSATVTHHAGQSSRTARKLANREFHRSAYRYYVTHVLPYPWHPARALAWTVLTARSVLKGLTL